jgi:ARC6-like, IMS domain
VKSIQIWKNLAVIACLVTGYGCQGGQAITNSLLPGPSSDTCSDMPQGKLDAKDVKKISLGTQPVRESKTIRVGQNLAYNFDAKAGDKLSWRTSENICVWVFAPDTKLLKGSDLPINGNYTVQVSVPKGTTTFTLEMGLGNTLQATNSSTASISSTSQPSSIQTQPTQTTVASASSSSLSQAQATSIVQNWLNSKGRVFGRPFDRQLADQYTTGLRYKQITQPGGSIDWLIANNSYYTYAITRVDNVWAFNISRNSAEIKLRVTEDLTLHNSNGGIDPERSGSTTANYIYYLTQDNGIWKIHDSRKIIDAE